MIVNLNVACKVQLNEFGKQIWSRYLEALDIELKDHPDHDIFMDQFKRALKENDICEMALWEIMNVFGPYLNLHSSPFTTTTIELQRNLKLGEITNES